MIHRCTTHHGMPPATITRRRLLGASLAASLGLPPHARAANTAAYPHRPITIVSPFAAGGADALLRMALPRLTQLLGQPIIIENIGGAGGLVGIERVVRAAPDGYTLLFAPSSASVTAPLLAKPARIDILRDLAPIIATHETPQVLFVHPRLAVHSVAQLIDYAKTHDELSYGSAGNGSVMHLNGELFNAAARLQLLHVPFRGISAMMNDTLAGRIPVGFSTISSTHGHIMDGRLKALAILDHKPSPFLPGVPPITQDLPGFRQSDTWSCMLAPAGLNPASLSQLYQAFKATLHTSSVQQLFTQNFAHVTALSPEETAQRIQSDIERTRQLIQAAGIKPQ